MCGKVVASSVCVRCPWYVRVKTKLDTCTYRPRLLLEQESSLSALQQHVDEGMFDDPPPSTSSFLRIREAQLGPLTLKSYQVEVSLHGLTTAIQPQPREKEDHLSPCKRVVWVPALILERALPLLVQRFKGREFTADAYLDPVCYLSSRDVCLLTSRQILPLLPQTCHQQTLACHSTRAPIDLTCEDEDHRNRTTPDLTNNIIIDLTGCDDDG